MKQKVLVFSAFDWCFLCVAIIIISSLFFIPFFDHNNRAILYMSIKQYEKAEKKWLQILSKDSFSSFYRMNLALNYILFNKPDKAIQEYEITRNLLKAGTVSGSFKTYKQSGVRSDISTSEDEIVEPEVVQKDTERNYKDKILFYSFFNSAAASTQEGEVESALSFYQQALGPYPNSLEIKTNIELLAMNSQASAKKGKDKKDKSNKKNKEDGKGDASKGSSEKKEEGKKEGKSSKENKENNKENEGKDEKDQQDNNGEKDSDQEKKQEEQQSARENSESDTTGKDSQDSPESQSGKQGGSDRTQSVNERQKEAILKAILEQEKKIRERRNQKRKRSSPVEKDW